MIIVNNPSPLTSRAAIKQLELLQRLYNRMVIPPGIYEELTLAGIIPGGQEMQAFTWIERRQVINKPRVKALQKVDLGEAEALALAIELKAYGLAIDKPQDRKIASRMGVKYIGILGCYCQGNTTA